MKECVLCGSTERLTVDHIIPKWLYGKIHVFGLKKNLGKKNHQTLCQKCNSKKGGLPDFNHPVAQPLKEALLKILNS